MTLEERFDALLGMPESTSSGKTLFWQVTEDDAADLLALLEAAKAEGIREGMKGAAPELERLRRLEAADLEHDDARDAFYSRCCEATGHAYRDAFIARSACIAEARAAAKAGKEEG